MIECAISAIRELDGSMRPYELGERRRDPSA